MQNVYLVPEQIKAAWGFEKDTRVIPFGNGLINHTWKVTNGTQEYILQKINQQVFHNPQAIAQNISSISRYFSRQAPHYLFAAPVPTVRGDAMYCHPEFGCFRLFPFIQNSHSVDVVSTTKQAYEAAKAFGRFTLLLSAFDANALAVTIPDFHNLTLRYSQFETATATGNKDRLQKGSKLFQNLIAHRSLVDDYEQIKTDSQFKIRVTHHDTKISNVLLDEDANALCVIDLDTVMPGYFISDVGDMMRTYLSPAGENETDFSKIKIRVAYFKAIVSGYLHQMNGELTDAEKHSFVYAGKALAYMQALRFFTDYLNNDVYYGAAYETHNLVRAQNQAVLLQRLCEDEAQLQMLVQQVLKETHD